MCGYDDPKSAAPRRTSSVGHAARRHIARDVMGWHVCVVLVGWLVLGPVVDPVSALQSYQSRIPNGQGISRNGVSWPGVAHNNRLGSGALNAFGIAFSSAGRTFTTALCEADSDGDGYTNGDELGDPNCTWTSGSTPSRTTGLSHPGFADSTPVTAADTTTAPPDSPTSVPGGASEPFTRDAYLRNPALYSALLATGVMLLVILINVIALLWRRRQTVKQDARRGMVTYAPCELPSRQSMVIVDIDVSRSAKLEKPPLSPTILVH